MNAPNADFTTATFELGDINGHYEDPKPNGCGDDEEAVKINGIDGDFCAPKCTGNECPTDVPDGCTAKPMCAL